MSWLWCISYGLHFLVFFLFHFLCKMIMLLQFFSILRIWVRDFVHKLNVLFWTIALFVGGCLCNFLCVEKSRNKEKKWSQCFVEKRIKKTTFEHPFSFPLPPLFMPFFSSTTISSMSNFNTQVILENWTMINMWRWVLVLVESFYIHCYFLKNNFIAKYDLKPLLPSKSHMMELEFNQNHSLNLPHSINPPKSPKYIYFLKKKKIWKETSRNWTWNVRWKMQTKAWNNPKMNTAIYMWIIVICDIKKCGTYN